jgi:hypothetical protein
MLTLLCYCEFSGGDIAMYKFKGSWWRETIYYGEWPALATKENGRRLSTYPCIFLVAFAVTELKH